MSKLKTNEVVLISPNGLVEKTLTLGDDGVVKIDGIEQAGVVSGTFMPTLIGLTTTGTGNVYAVQSGLYTKVGNLVTVYGRIALSTKGNATGLALISGLPFPAKAITARIKGHISQAANITGVTLDVLNGTYLTNVGGVAIFVLDNKDGTGVNFTSITNSTILDFLATYSTD